MSQTVAVARSLVLLVSMFFPLGAILRRYRSRCWLVEHSVARALTGQDQRACR
ncbi:hypothetical protein CGRA01v4_04956 [Colletotrichum graminicola]|nr:hypothetical protein CGRA01v4_04956 [Colletotrichum graminicola]